MLSSLSTCRCSTRPERAGAELRVEAGLAEVVEHLGGGFEADAGFFQALLNLLELDADSLINLFPDVKRYLTIRFTICILVMASVSTTKHTKLNDLQISLLRLFEHEMTHAEELELRRQLVKYYSGQVATEATRIDEERGYIAEDFERMLNQLS